MELSNEFTVPLPVEQAWPTLLDVERVAPCMPGTTVESVDGDEITAQVKIKLGAITTTYRGTGRFVEKDETSHRVTLEASGKERRGNGTAGATMRAQLEEAGGQTRVTVHTDLTVTGRPAQFGRGVMNDVATKLLDQFAACLASELQASG